MHSEVDGQLAEGIPTELTFAVDHALVPPVGFVDVMTSPPPVVATQRLTDGQLTATTSADPSTCVLDHELATVGVVEVRT
jgi:hypothetical protein